MIKIIFTLNFMARLSHLNALQALEATLRHGSMRLAAEELGITPAALGQRIKSLEDYLGYPLLKRARDGVFPSPATIEVQQKLQNGFAQLFEVARGLQFDSPNTITLRADQNWFECWLKPRLPKLAEKFPNLIIEVNVQRDSALATDLCISFCPIDSDAKLLFKEYLAPVVTPAMHRRLHQRDIDNILENQPLLHLEIYQSDVQALDWGQWFKRFGYRSCGFDRGIRYNSAKNALEAICNNSGTLLAGLSLCLHRMKNQELCLLFTPELGDWTQYGYCLNFPARPRIQVEKFIAWLEKEAEATRLDMESLLSNSHKN